MNKSDLIENFSSEAGLTIAKADKLVSLVFDEMSEALANGERVEIRGFGSFKTKRYGGYVGRNPNVGGAASQAEEFAILQVRIGAEETNKF